MQRRGVPIREPGPSLLVPVQPCSCRSKIRSLSERFDEGKEIKGKEARKETRRMKRDQLIGRLCPNVSLATAPSDVSTL